MSLSGSSRVVPSCRSTSRGMNPFGDDLDFDEGDPFGDDDNADDDEAEGGSGAVQHYGAEHLLLLLDCDASMFEQYVPCLRSSSSSSNNDDDENDNGKNTDDKNSDGGKTAGGIVHYSPMDVAITAAHRLLRSKVRDAAETKSGKRDGVGVLLYGCNPNRRRPSSPRLGVDSNFAASATDDSSIDEDGDRDPLPTTHELVELVAPGIEQVLTMQKCLPDEDENLAYDNKGRCRRDLCGEFSVKKCRDGGVKEDEARDANEVISLRRALTAALKVFSNAKCVRTLSPASKELPDSKTVWIFTNQDDPCHGSKDQKTAMDTLKRDCQDAGISLHVLPLPKRDGSFNKEIFFKDLVTRPTDDGEEEEYSTIDPSNDAEYSPGVDGKSSKTRGVMDIDTILDKFHIATKKRRKYATLPLLLPGWKGCDGADDRPGIMLDLYGVVQVRNKPQKVPVHQENNKMTTRKTVRIVTESGEEVFPENIHHFAEFCGRVSIPPANVATMKRLTNSLDKAGLVIHGFRPMRLLHANLMSRSVLAIPNDFRVNGSGRALYNLKQSMKRKNVFAVGELLLRVSATSRMVALVPNDEESESMIITQLPYKEDVRDVPHKDIGPADRDSVDAAKRMIEKCTLSCDATDFADSLPENPYLKHFFGYLESVSLGKNLGDVEDGTRQNVTEMREQAVKEIKDFANCLPEDEVPIKADRKRKAAPSSLKVVPEKETIPQEWIEMFKNDEIVDLKNDELKAFLKSQGERLTGKKADLVDRVQRCIEKELFND